MIIFFKLPPFYSVFMKFRPFRAICLHQKGRSCMILRVRFTFWWSWSVQKLKFFCHFMERSGAKKVNFHYLKNNKSKKTGNWSLDELSGHSCLLKNLSLPLLAPCKQIITEKHFFPCFSKSWRHSAPVPFSDKRRFINASVWAAYWSRVTPVNKSLLSFALVSIFKILLCLFDAQSPILYPP